MLNSLMKEHAVKQQQQREHVERLRKEALESVFTFTNSTVNSLNASVSEAYYNQRKIDAETRSLQAKVSKFRQQTTQWLKLVESLRTSLRELGDVQSWAHAMQQDMEIVNDTLELAYSDHRRARDHELQSMVTSSASTITDDSSVHAATEQKDEVQTPTVADPPPTVHGKVSSTHSYSTLSTVSATSDSSKPDSASVTHSQASSYVDDEPSG